MCRPFVKGVYQNVAMVIQILFDNYDIPNSANLKYESVGSMCSVLCIMSVLHLMAALYMGTGKSPNQHLSF